MGFLFPSIAFQNLDIKKKKVNCKLLLEVWAVWVLQFEVSEFEIYFLKFGGIWISHTDVIEFRFYLGVWILFFSSLEVFEYYILKFQNLRCKILTPLNFRVKSKFLNFKIKSKNFQTLECIIQTSPNFRGVICNLPYQNSGLNHGPSWPVLFSCLLFGNEYLISIFSMLVL